MKDFLRNRAATLRIIAIYSIVGFLWIYGSDTVLGWLVHDSQVMVKIAIYKGSIFIILTSLLLYFLIYRYNKRLATSEQTLKENTRYLLAILETEPECVKLLDSECNLLMMNRAGLDMIQADSLDQVKGHCICPIITEPYRSAFMELNRQVFQGIPGTLEFEIIGLKGKSVWLETRAVPFYNDKNEVVSQLGITRDITTRKKAEDDLRKIEERYRTVVDNIPLGVSLIDRDYHIIMTNRTQADMFGHPAEWFIGKHCYDVFEKRPEACGHCPGSVCMTSGTMSDAYTTGIRDDGSSFDAHIRTAPLLGDQGEPYGFIEVVEDISELKLAEAERHNLEQQLLHTQKLESLGVLAGGIAHDFNNILMAIMGNADLALMRINKESPAVENLHRIEKAAAQAADLAKQMLAYSGKGKFFVDNIDMNRLLEEMLHMLEVSISKKAVLRLNLHRPLPPVEADTTQMRQIVMNLVINASEAIGDKSGVIAITTGCMDCDRSYLKDVWLDENLQDGLYLYLEVADTGCGMDKDTMAKLFDPFFTTKFTGRGLGMAAVLGIVRGHKGAIKVYSEPGKGTSFKILLPANGRPAGLFKGDAIIDSWRGSGMVLLVDDDETIRGIGAEMLKELGFTTITANDGREAVDIFRTTPGIAFIILDLTMPHMDGEQCFRELRLLSPDVKIIMSSGYNEQEVTQKFAGKGMAGFIQKPYSLSTLKDALKSL